MAWSWKRIALITIAVVVGLQVLGFCVYLYFANTINDNIRAAIVEYIRSRARVEASSATQGKLMIDIGDIDYTYVTGSLDIDDLSVVYRDSTLDSGSIIALDVPTIAISGITPWDIIDGYCNQWNHTMGYHRRWWYVLWFYPCESATRSNARLAKG
jgi:hypothetical protein